MGLNCSKKQERFWVHINFRQADLKTDIRMKNIIIKAFLFFLFLPLLSNGQIEGEVVKPRKGKFLLNNATVITVTQGIIENGSLLISDGKIEAMGTNIADRQWQ